MGKSKKRIPGGNMLLSKRPELYLPKYWPAYFVKTKKCFVWDLNGKKYTDLASMSVGTNILGYCNKSRPSCYQNSKRRKHINFKLS